MQPETKNIQPFELLIFEGNDSKSAMNNMRTGLAERLDQLLKQGTPMKPCGAPVIFQEDNFFKIMIMLWADHTFFVMSMISPVMGPGSSDNTLCDHSCGYEKNVDGQLICKKCRTPLL
jgi:hypothetical protein